MAATPKEREDGARATPPRTVAAPPGGHQIWEGAAARSRGREGELPAPEASGSMREGGRPALPPQDLEVREGEPPVPPDLGGREVEPPEGETAAGGRERPATRRI
jgi:hypothetical protein